jgi:hypothetical protein
VELKLQKCAKRPTFSTICANKAADNQLDQWQSPGLGSDPSWDKWVFLSSGFYSDCSWDKWVSLVPHSLQIILGTKCVSLVPVSLQIVLGTIGFP